MIDHSESTSPPVADDGRVSEEIETARAMAARATVVLGALGHALLNASSEPTFLQDVCRAMVTVDGIACTWIALSSGEPSRPTEAAQAWRPDVGAAEAGRSISEVPSDEAPGADPPGGETAATSLSTGLAAVGVGSTGAVAAVPLLRRGAVIGALVACMSSAQPPDHDTVELLTIAAAQLAFGIDILRLRVEHAGLEVRELPLATAVQQAYSSVMITDAAGTITYVNPAFERITGYSAAEVVGRNPRMMQSGDQGPEFYRQMWETLSDGRVWRGTFVNRARDGSQIVAEATISPVRSNDGKVVGYVSEERDVTRERAAEAAFQRELRERSEIVTALEAVPASASADQMADAMCREISAAADVKLALVTEFFGSGHATTLAARGQAARVYAVGEPLPGDLARYLASRARLGLWVDQDDPGVNDGSRWRALQALGIGAMVSSPLRVEGEVVGLLTIGAGAHVSSERMHEHILPLAELWVAASAHLSPLLSARRRHAVVVSELERLIERREFTPVFQPIVDLFTGATVGYEALTRFSDETPPSVRFEQAETLGLGPQLEASTLDAALRASRALPAGAWLDVNVSPAFVSLLGRPFAALIAEANRRIVVELTEHTAISDYVALRQALADLGPNVGLAVDDAGAGHASLQHILELNPAYVKLDISIVRGIDRDPARQAMVAGIRYFALKTSCGLVAEGVETEAEAQTLRTLAVPFAQGYLFGRPEPVLGRGRRR